MIIKIVLLFLVAIGVLGMTGRILPGARRPRSGRGRRSLSKEARRCPDCGSYMVGSGPCPCRKSGSGPKT